MPLCDDPHSAGRRAAHPRGMLLLFALLVAAALSGCAAVAPRDQVAVTAAKPNDTPICFDCFWQYQPKDFQDELTEWYENHPSTDPLIDADRLYLLARTKNDPVTLKAARQAFLSQRARETNLLRRLMIDETLAFTAAECADNPVIWFDHAARSAARAGQPFKARVYREIADGTFVPKFGTVEIRRHLDVPPGTTAYILGQSVIRVAPGEKIGCQMERTVRDWLSYQLNWDFSGRSPVGNDLIPWHEGSRLHDILEAVPAQITPLPGVLAVKHGDDWFAADDQGVFRFQVLIDKMEYPTTRVHGNVALIVDTHGMSALVEPAVRSGARLVVACGDTPYKAQAAWWLAQRGIDCYFPCDRMVADLLGYEGKGTLIGSAPVRSENGVAVIGDRPVRISLTETVVAEDTKADGGNQYYDAPARYFRRLAESLPIKLETVMVTGPDQSQRVTDRAERIGADVIAVRCRTVEDAQAVRKWLKGSRSRCAVLFHTAPYPEGYKLYEEFPGQTTFGDPRPKFVTERAVYDAGRER